MLNHDLRRLKKTNGRKLLSMSRHRPVATHMNRILPKVRDRMSERWNRLHQCEGQPWA